MALLQLLDLIENMTGMMMDDQDDERESEEREREYSQADRVRGRESRERR